MAIYLIITTILVVIDQVSKFLTVQNIALNEIVEVIPNIVSLTYIRNTGAAFSILEGEMWFFYIVTIVVVIFLVYYMYTEAQENKILGILLAIILAGALGNFIDRLFHQFVIDMIKLEFIDFAIFNIADTYLTVGVTLLFIYSIYEDRQEKNINIGDKT